MRPIARGRLALALLAALAVPLPAAEVAARGLLEVMPGAALSVPATESLVVLAEPLAAGEPVKQGALLAELDLARLHRELDDTQKSLEELQAERRNHPSIGVTARGTSAAESSNDIKVAQATSELLDLQGRIARAALRAPEDGYVVRFFYAVGAKAKKRKPFLEFARLADVRLRLSVPAAESAPFPANAEVLLIVGGTNESRFRGRVETATPEGGEVVLSIRPLELPYLHLGVEESVRLLQP